MQQLLSQEDFDVDFRFRRVLLQRMDQWTLAIKRFGLMSQAAMDARDAFSSGFDAYQEKTLLHHQEVGPHIPSVWERIFDDGLECMRAFCELLEAAGTLDVLAGIDPLLLSLFVCDPTLFYRACHANKNQVAVLNHYIAFNERHAAVHARIVGQLSRRPIPFHHRPINAAEHAVYHSLFSFVGALGALNARIPHAILHAFPLLRFFTSPRGLYVGLGIIDAHNNGPRNYPYIVTDAVAALAQSICHLTMGATFDVERRFTLGYQTEEGRKLKLDTLLLLVPSLQIHPIWSAVTTPEFLVVFFTAFDVGDAMFTDDRIAHFFTSFVETILKERVSIVAPSQKVSRLLCMLSSNPTFVPHFKRMLAQRQLLGPLLQKLGEMKHFDLAVTLIFNLFGVPLEKCGIVTEDFLTFSSFFSVIGSYMKGLQGAVRLDLEAVRAYLMAEASDQLMRVQANYIPAGVSLLRSCLRSPRAKWYLAMTFIRDGVPFREFHDLLPLLRSYLSGPDAPVPRPFLLSCILDMAHVLCDIYLHAARECVRVTLLRKASSAARAKRRGAKTKGKVTDVEREWEAVFNELDDAMEIGVGRVASLLDYSYIRKILLAARQELVQFVRECVAPRVRKMAGQEGRWAREMGM